jgi:hypothetical protein
MGTASEQTHSRGQINDSHLHEERWIEAEKQVRSLSTAARTVQVFKKPRLAERGLSEGLCQSEINEIGLDTFPAEYQNGAIAGGEWG